MASIYFVCFLCFRSRLEVHESTHHEFAYSDDVYMCARSHYLWLSVDGLINLNGHVANHARNTSNALCY